MSYQVRTAKFEGPLGLLLELIEDKRLDIADISLKEVADQYLAYLESDDLIPMDQMADFLVVAAKLLWIKSCLLVPAVTQADDSESDLSVQLRVYKDFLEVYDLVGDRLQERDRLYWRETEDIAETQNIASLQSLEIDKAEIASAFANVARRLPSRALPLMEVGKEVSIKEKISHLQALLRQYRKFPFSHIMKTGQTRRELIVTFLAMLELIKCGEAKVCQDTCFSEIIIYDTAE